MKLEDEGSGLEEGVAVKGCGTPPSVFATSCTSTRTWVLRIVTTTTASVNSMPETRISKLQSVGVKPPSEVRLPRKPRMGEDGGKGALAESSATGNC